MPQENLRKAREEWDAKEAAYKKEVSDTQRQVPAPTFSYQR